VRQVGLKYVGARVLRCDETVKDGTGAITELKCTIADLAEVRSRLACCFVSHTRTVDRISLCAAHTCSCAHVVHMK
jgi:hypothetical protein